MRVRRLNGHDWTFGRGRADYVKDQAAIAQNIKTRLLSFKNDWFLDIDANIDWMNLLGQRGTEKIIENEVARVILTTSGVVRINSLSLQNKERRVIIEANITTIFGNDTITVGISA
jgi:hypothetical protein